MTLTFGSLFSGIGGFDLGFEQAGLSCAWQVEIDAAARSVLATHWPNVLRYEDVRHVGRHNLQPVDVICGGFPCQDLSVAGKRAGLAGERSGLWFEFHRILAELEPRWVVIENVPGLLSSHGGRDFAVLLRGLVELRYGVTWRVLDAQYFGVAQRRRRVFLVASLGDGRSAEVLFESAGSIGHPAPRRETGQGVAGTLTGGVDGGRSHGKPNGSDRRELVAAPLTASGRGTERTGESRGQDTVIPVAYNVQHNDGGQHKRQDRPNGGMYVNATDTALTVGTTDLTCIAYPDPAYCLDDATGTRTGSGRDAQDTFVVKRRGGFGCPAETTDVTPTLEAQAGTHQGGPDNVPYVMAFAQNTREEVRLLNGDGQQAGALSAEPGMHQQTFIACGVNGTDVGYSLRANPSHSGDKGDGGINTSFAVAFQSSQSGCREVEQHATLDSHNGSRRQNGVVLPVGVRRLTPTECERLQGFPDGHTAGQSDSARYRQLGNAVCVSVARWLGQRIAEQEPSP